MKQGYIICLLVLFTTNLLSAQGEPEYVEVSVGPGYIDQTYYNFDSQSAIAISHEDWDIAFSVLPGGAGIFVNEGSPLSFGTPAAEIKLYYSTDDDFDTADTMNIVGQLLNDELSWASGAFNAFADPGNPFDLGWGTYNVSNHSITSNFIFFIELRSGVWRKLEITSLVSGVYTFRHTNLDGSDLVEQTIDKANFPEKTLAYYAVESNSVLDLEPAHWDLLFTRYYSPLDDNGETLEYMVTGVLTNTGVTVEQVDGIDPEAVDYTQYLSDLEVEDSLYTLGHDWKAFDFATGWNIPEDRVYFVKTATDSIWQVQFLDFTGSSMGTTTFVQTYMGLLVDNEEIVAQASEMKLFPNPVAVGQKLTVTWPLEDVVSSNAMLQVVNGLGQIVTQEEVGIQSGLNQFELDSSFAVGMYWLRLQIGTSSVTRPFVVAN